MENKLYSVRIHPSVSWLKCADIYMNDQHGFAVDHHIHTVYALTWRGLTRKINSWMKQHKHDVPVNWYIQ
jgi:hypothetical protein